MASKLMKRWKGKAKAREGNASQQVLNTYELLEPILLHLTPPDLRRVRFVSKAWNEVITRSVPLNAEWQYFPKKYIKEMQLMLFGDQSAAAQPLLDNYIKDHYCEYYDPTLEEAYRKQIIIDKEVWILDMCYYYRMGEEQFSRLSALFSARARHADCYAVVYSSTSRRTFENVRNWHSAVESVELSETSFPLYEPGKRPILVGLIETKCDWKEEREVRISEGVQLARELGCAFYQTAQYSRYNLDKAFPAMARTCINAMKLRDAVEVPQRPKSKEVPESQEDCGHRRRFSLIRRRLTGSSNG